MQQEYQAQLQQQQSEQARKDREAQEEEEAQERERQRAIREQEHERRRRERVEQELRELEEEVARADSLNPASPSRPRATAPVKSKPVEKKMKPAPCTVPRGTIRAMTDGADVLGSVHVEGRLLCGLFL
jgi:hypothetical protein